MALALYRKYRPASFAEMVGQEHVTEPLCTALAGGRINHAYLFSGPRGCGKTSSARIMARSLNCVNGPTPNPCGTCDSCVALAPEGSGNVDVVELDAASHGGVEDTRELRDRAFYAPAQSRYRVFIIDEAHMVTTQGFNALLKIVEEPPEHLIFIFATTEPEKVLPTIRSRTHQYPFRLMAPGAMRALIERVCGEEGVTVEPAVYPLVIRAGGGSGRDTLSVLDQLLAGAGPEGVTYERAVSLLGVTDIALIDDMVDALAAGDGGAVFDTVNSLVEAGHDPRRFAGDLLDRLRDLVLISAVPDATTRGLVDAPGDQLERMTGQARLLGAATLSRYAEIVHTGLTEMRGATAPRLLMDLLCARMLLPSASDAESAVLQRVEILERRLAAGAGAAPSQAARVSVEPRPRAETPPQPSPAPPARPAATERPTRDFQRPSRTGPTPPSITAPPAEVERPVAPPPVAAPETPPTTVVASPVAGAAVDAAAVRQAWSEVLSTVRGRSRSTEAMLTNATVSRVDGDTVVLTHPAPPLVRRLAESRNTEVIAQALETVLGGTWRVCCEDPTGPDTAGSPPPTTPPPAASRRVVPSPAARPPAPPVARPITPPPPEPPAEEPPPDPGYETGGEETGVADEPESTPDPESAVMELLRERLSARELT